jgi:hypothetical protein
MKIRLHIRHRRAVGAPCNPYPRRRIPHHPPTIFFTSCNSLHNSSMAVVAGFEFPAKEIQLDNRTVVGVEVTLELLDGIDTRYHHLWIAGGRYQLFRTDILQAQMPSRKAGP